MLNILLLIIIMSILKITSSISDKVKGSLIGFYAGDALAMPVHWYYDLNQLKKDFGSIKKFEKPKNSFPGSIMNLSNTGGGGRGSDQGNIVGDVILHGKKDFWIKGKNYHYHHGMQEGENTLDALITRLLIQSMIKTKQCFDINDFTQSYITFMTTPNSHNDTYAGTCHRMFFSNLQAGKTADQCPDNDGHNVDAIDALMIIPPIILANINSSKEVRDNLIKQAIKVTRNANKALPFAYIYSDMLLSIIKDGKNIKQVSIDAGIKLGIDIENEVKMNKRDPMTACYITSSFPALLYFSYKYGDNVREMLLASTNAGGENVARGSLLGALGGAFLGYDNFPDDLKNDLVLSKEYNEESDIFSSIFMEV